MNYMVDKEWLLKLLNRHDVRIADCRFALGNPEKGQHEYNTSHIPGAVYFDLEKDLSGCVREHGGRHPLPDMEEFIDKLGKAGINEKVTIVAYDNGEGAFAARFWWMLSYLGHEKVYVLNGGYKEWTSSNYPTTTEVPAFEKTPFNKTIQHHLLADVNEVREIASGANTNALLIDSREQKRYLGIEEPVDKKKGHIPKAVNKPWMEGLADGRYKTADEQSQRFSDIDRYKQLVVYCGSGVTAAPNFLALKEAGFDDVKLYLGSFSDWISYEDHEIE
ncbi:3-mercaptopyruvate sulfurtransferase [Bacillus sp. FJAT-27225]|uniref:sulfurtransferase n=1 Tax=Bacillus sp. FJAT-27225 TaxID=1743144 RepID=UPI00080C3468|nr:sulfurtransferase [Bacillus sp. FJAT-27225]OCA81621.1 3-mercaptopyruvate sulfurtransferase [Bacillus sp. FJAT-27225]